MSRIGIVIPFYGGNAYLPKLLSSIEEECMGDTVRIYIVDNSKPREKLKPGDVMPANVQVIDAGTGIGYGRACNTGFNKCKADDCEIMVIANQDGYFAKGSLRKLVDVLEQEKDCSAVLPLLTLYESDEVEWFFTYVYLTPMTDLVSDLFRKQVKPFYTARKLCGACFALRLADYKEIPYLFDELFHMYFEDEDLFNRLSKMKRKVYFVPDAVFHHTHGNTSNYEHETVSGMVVRRTSKLLYTLKQDRRKLTALLPGFLLLELATCLRYFFSLSWRNLLIEIISLAKVTGRLPAVQKMRTYESEMVKRFS